MTKSKRPTIGANPLDTLIPEQESLQRDQEEKREYREQSSKKERLTVHVPSDLIERARKAVYWTPGLTLAGLAEDAIRAALNQMEDTRGEVFPDRPGALKPGRPIGP